MEPIIQNRVGNKNVSTIIINYLTDPPPLPFIAELLDTTKWMLDDDDFWNYENYYVMIMNNQRSYVKQKYVYKNYLLYTNFIR